MIRDIYIYKKRLIRVLVFLLILPAVISNSVAVISIDILDFSSIEIDKYILNDTNERDKNISYLIKVNNTGDILMRNATLTDEFQPGMKYIDSTRAFSSEELSIEKIEKNTDGTTKTVTLLIGDIQTGQEKWIKLDAEYDMNNSTDINSNRAQAKGEALGQMIISNRAFVFSEDLQKGDQISVGPRMDVTSTFLPSMDESKTEYLIRVDNTGDRPFQDILIAGEIPAGLRFISSNPTPINDTSSINTTLLWKFKSLNAGESKTIIMTVDTGSSKSEQLKQNTTIRAQAQSEEHILETDVKKSVEMMETA